MNSYTETLSQSLSAISDEIVRRGIVLSESSQDWLDSFTFGGLSYGQDKEVHAEIQTIKGRTTRKYVHAHVWRHDISGRYEWLVYVL